MKPFFLYMWKYFIDKVKFCIESTLMLLLGFAWVNDDDFSIGSIIDANTINRIDMRFYKSRFNSIIYPDWQLSKEASDIWPGQR